MGDNAAVREGGERVLAQRWEPGAAELGAAIERVAGEAAALAAPVFLANGWSYHKNSESPTESELQSCVRLLLWHAVDSYREHGRGRCQSGRFDCSVGLDELGMMEIRATLEVGGAYIYGGPEADPTDDPSDCVATPTKAALP